MVKELTSVRIAKNGGKYWKYLDKSSVASVPSHLWGRNAGTKFQPRKIVSSMSSLSNVKEMRRVRNAGTQFQPGKIFSSISSLSNGSGKREPRKSGGGCGGEQLQPGDGKHIDWWEQMMKKCKKPSTRELIKRLVSTNLLGLDGTLKNGSLEQDEVPNQLLKSTRRFPHEIILTRVGKFYEAAGLDACVLVEYAGLKPKGEFTDATTVPKTSCPIDDLRQTLTALTANGFSVCIFEEVKGSKQC